LRGDYDKRQTSLEINLVLYQTIKRDLEVNGHFVTLIHTEGVVTSIDLCS